MNKELKILVFDYETSPMKGYFFGNMWETNIVKIEEFETIICASYWDSKTNKIKSIAQWDFKGHKNGKWDDKKLVKFFRDMLIDGDYDIIAGQNSDQFDIKVFNARLAYHGFDPIPEYKTLDTKKIAKSKLKLPSYSLEIIAKFFGLDGKYHHSGLDMWFKSRDGDKKAQKEMTHYCNVDVIKTKDVLLKLLPFMKDTSLYKTIDYINPNCTNPVCLSKKVIKSKKRKVSGGYRYQYQCKDCGSYFTDKILIK